MSVEALNPKKHGDLDQSKVVTENIMGLVAGLPRGYDFEEYQDSAVQEKEIVHDSREDGPFAEIAFGQEAESGHGPGC